ncbi:MAG: carboxypeptidase-like regulatory domain-containing protein [Armatimonadetes bacterium]|nr:carboxypeptidase-like regulatory domain-containing protein [Armatimonadota bacterium]MDW8029715.1 DUF2012 domain-containing protein [Armatimonadota bacterium]
MKWFVWILALMTLMGCGGGIVQKVSSGLLTVVVRFPPQRAIPPEAQRVRVQVTGQGLTQPLEQIAERPYPEGGEVRVIFRNVPVGPKTVSATAEDRYGTHRAIGTAETNIIANQTTTVAIELALTNLASVVGRIINIRTGQPAVNVTIRLGDRQGVSQTDGNFVVTNVPEGSHTLTVSSPEYRSYSKDVTVSVPLTDLGEIFALPQQLMEPPDQPEF